MSGRILIIDDDEYNLNELRIILQERGYEVEVARDRAEGVDRGNHFLPDLVISEVPPGGLSGIKVPSRTTAKTGLSAPVIFYTGFYREEQARKHVTSKYGAIHYFVKPYQREALIKAVTGIFRQLEESCSMVQEESGSSSAGTPGKREVESSVQSSTHVLGDSDSKVAPDSESIVEDALRTQQNPRLPVIDNAASPLTYEAADQVLPSDSISEPLIQESTPVSAPPPLSHEESSSKAPRVETAASNDPSSLERESRKEARQASLEWDNLYQKYYAASLAQPPSSSGSILRSRRAQIVALVFLFFLGFFFLRSYIPRLQKKKDTTTLNIQPRPAPAQTSSSTPSASPPTKELSTPRLDQQLANDNALSAAPPSLQPDTHLKKDSSRESSKSDPPKKIETPSTSSVLDREPLNGDSGPSINVVISDITGGGRPPFLLKSKRPVVSPQLIQSASAKALVIRIVVNREGKVLEAVPVNEGDSNTFLSRTALAAIRSWKFSPIRGSKGDTATKYFSFKVVRS